MHPRPSPLSQAAWGIEPPNPKDPEASPFPNHQPDLRSLATVALPPGELWHPLHVSLTAGFGAAAEDGSQTLALAPEPLWVVGRSTEALSSWPVSVRISSLLPGPCSQKREALFPAGCPPPPPTLCLLPGTGARSRHTAAGTTASLSASAGPAHMSSWVSGLPCLPWALLPLLCSQGAPGLRFSFHVGVPMQPP